MRARIFSRRDGMQRCVYSCAVVVCVHSGKERERESRDKEHIVE